VAADGLIGICPTGCGTISLQDGFAFWELVSEFLKRIGNTGPYVVEHAVWDFVQQAAAQFWFVEPGLSGYPLTQL
jgi:hypothetical protein